MSIQKKSLISTLKTAKKANVASSHDSEAKGSKVSSMRVMQPKSTLSLRKYTMKSTKISAKATVNFKASR